MKSPILSPRLSVVKYSACLLIILSFVFVKCDDRILDASSKEPPLKNPTSQNFLSSSTTLPSGALFDIQLPEEWSDLVIYNHGYINPQAPLAVPDDTVDGQTVAEIVNQLGFAYAATSYQTNGLVGPEAVQDILELAQLFINQHGTPDHIYLVGVSEGALITTLAVEQHEEFSGGIAACGPVGDFEKQLRYLGDFHVLFNLFYPGLIPGDPTGVPEATIDQWLMDNNPLHRQVTNALNAKPNAARTLLKVANVPIQDFSDMDEIRNTIFSLLQYNVLATNNAIQRLEGQPYDNQDKFYSGTGSFFTDIRLNRQINRFTADGSALSMIESEFQTKGELARPLVMTHTTGDQEVPYWHEPLYRIKALSEGSFLFHSNIPILNRYGHCNFKLSELLISFSLMVLKVTLQDLSIPPSIFKNEQQKQDFLDLARKQGIEPVFKEELRSDL